MSARWNWRAALRERWPVVVVAVTPLVLFWRLLFTGKVLFWGLPLLQFYPWRWLVLQQIRAGEFPLWNPYLGAGAPLLANYQSGVLYPPNWLGYLPGLPLDYSLGLGAVLHIILAGLGMVAFVRALGLRQLGQAVAGLAFSLSGYLVGRLSFLTIIAAAAWLPWLLWAVERLIQAPAGVLQAPAGLWGRLAGLRRYAGGFLALAGLMALQLLAGHAQTTFYSLLLAGAWAAWRGWSRDEGAHWRACLSSALSRAALFGAALAFALALAAAQLLPTAELLRESPRAEAADYQFVVTYSYWPWRLLTLAAPDAFGNPAYGNYWGYPNYWEGNAYVGVLPLGLALLAVVEWARRRGRPAGGPRLLAGAVPLLVGTAAVALLLAMGQNTPVFPFFYRYVPSFNLFQAPARMMIWFVWAVAALAGAGADAWARPQGRWRAWTGRGMALGLGVALAGVLARVGARSAGLAGAVPVFETMPRAVGLAGVLMAGAFGLSLTKPTGEATSRWTAAVVGFLALDLILAGYALNPVVDAALYRQPTASGPALRAWLGGKRLFQSEDDEYRAKYLRFFRFEDFGSSDLNSWLPVREAQLPNLGLLEGIASASNFDPLIPGRYAGLLSALKTAEPGQAEALLRAMGVQALVSAAPPPGMAAILNGDGFGVYAVPGSAERIRIAYALQAAPDAEHSLAFVTDPGFDPDLFTVIETPEQAGLYHPTVALCRSRLFEGLAHRYSGASIGPVLISGQAVCQYHAGNALNVIDRSLSALADVPQAAAFGIGPAGDEDVLGPWQAARDAPSGQPVLLTESPTHIRIAAPMEFSGYLVLSDTFYPGWRAYVDGQRSVIVPANHAFRAVFVPAGRHLVEFRYQPESFQAGALISGLAWLLFAVLAGSRFMSRRDSPAAA